MATQHASQTPSNLVALLDEVIELRERVASGARLRLERYRARYPGGFTPAACNLASYLALRSEDLRPLQERLVEAGVSSLGRGEAQVTTNLDRVIAILSNALGIPERLDLPDTGPQYLERQTDVLFGSRTHQRYARIMVTMPTEAATRRDLVAALVASGMDCARINCAHDGPPVWQGMIDNIRAVEAETGTRVRLFMDLAGHKIRTGPVQPGRPVLRLKVPRDAMGQPVGTGRVILTSRTLFQAGTTEHPSLPRIPLSPCPPAQIRDTHEFAGSASPAIAQIRDTHEFAGSASPAIDVVRGIRDSHESSGEPPLDHLLAGDRLVFNDARNKQRILHLRERLASGEWLAEIGRGAYIVPGLPIRVRRGSGRSAQSGDLLHVDDFPGKPLPIRLFRNHRFVLRRDARPGRPAQDDGSAPAEIGCSHPEVIDQIEPGHAVWIDDGKLGCVVEQVRAEGALLRVTHAGPKGVRIGADKGINLPDTRLPLPALTDKDLADLDFVCGHADIVGLSFVRTLDDVDELRRQLTVRAASELPIVAKIETAEAVRNLPDILLGTSGLHALGVMIARGDLAVELGSVRMAEIQEEILWICEAAHVPVIWATQVLESLAKNGVINRPEITDAAMSVRAECVMMNKGPFIADAAVILNDILTRMDAHLYKKVSRLRRLHWR